MIRLILTLFGLLAGINVSALPAFPGAEGYGSDTIGGRGGTVLKVTKLDCDGTPGSLDWALTRTYPRIVVFEVAGVINCNNNNLEVGGDAMSYLTVAGQTAPGDGVIIQCTEIHLEAVHDVIIRGLRIRTGDTDDSSCTIPESRDPLAIRGLYFDKTKPAYNIIIDHNSIGWGTDENLGTGYKVHDVTFSYNIISEGLHCGETNSSDCFYSKDHAFNLILTPNEDEGQGWEQERISVHHNFLANSSGRNPEAQWEVDVEFINNLVYNWRCTNDSLRWDADIINNHYQRGSITNSGGCLNVYRVKKDSNNDSADWKLYLAGNIGPGRPVDDATDAWDLSLSFEGITESAVKRTVRFMDGGVSIDQTSDTSDVVLNGNGVNGVQKGAGAWPRDSHDLRVVNNFLDCSGAPDEATGCTGQRLESESPNATFTIADVGGWGTYSGTPETDSDGDGMPDSWENANGTNPNSADANGDVNGNGYDNIEDYINSFFPAEAAPQTPPAAPGIVTAVLTPEEVILDNGDTGTSSTGTWAESSATGEYQGSSLFSSTASSTYTWQVPISYDGNYRVYVWHAEHPDRRVDVPLEITHDGGTANFDVDMTTGGGVWVDYGSYTFKSSGTVKVTAEGCCGPSGGQSAGADAVRFVQEY